MDEQQPEPFEDVLSNKNTGECSMAILVFWRCTIEYLGGLMGAPQGRAALLGHLQP